MDKVKMNIWKRPCQLKVIFECYGNQDPTIGQKKRLDAFVADNMCVDGALPEVKKFCLADENMNDNYTITDIFEYVAPRSLYIKRNNEEDIVALLCDYKFDNEHGIAVVFQNKEFSEIVQEGEI